MPGTSPAAPPRRIGPWATLGLVVLGGLALLVVVIALWLHDLTTPDDGDRYAAELGERVAVGIADDVEPSYAEPLDAETLADRAVTDPRLPGGAAIEVDALGWEGQSGEPDGARIDLAVSVESPSWSGDALFADSRTAGSSESCWQLVVHAHQHDDTADLAEVRCPDEPVAMDPEPSPLPSLAPDAEQVVLGMLDDLPDDATAADAEAVLSHGLPDFVDVRTVREGEEIVAAVGVVRSRDCVVAVLPADEPAWRFSNFDRILLEPGEVGCSPSLYTAPVTTH